MSKPEVNTENYLKFREVALEINKKLKQIEQDTGFHSSPSPTLEHKDFRSLVEMGEKIIPYIFYRGTQEGWSWTLLLLLSEIVTEKPVLPGELAGKYMHVVHRWLGWYLDSKYSDTDIYYGLVD
jgi:hypothetical protein